MFQCSATLQENIMSALSVDTTSRINWVPSVLPVWQVKGKLDGGGGECGVTDAPVKKQELTTLRTKKNIRHKHDNSDWTDEKELDHYYFIYSKWSIFLATTLHDSPGPAAEFQNITQETTAFYLWKSFSQRTLLRKTPPRRGDFVIRLSQHGWIVCIRHWSTQE